MSEDNVCRAIAESTKKRCKNTVRSGQEYCRVHTASNASKQADEEIQEVESTVDLQSHIAQLEKTQEQLLEEIRRKDADYSQAIAEINTERTNADIRCNRAHEEKNAKCSMMNRTMGMAIQCMKERIRKLEAEIESLRTKLLELSTDRNTIAEITNFTSALDRGEFDSELHAFAERLTEMVLNNEFESIEDQYKFSMKYFDEHLVEKMHNN